MEPAITLFVALPTSIVSRAVDLYHQPGCQADEVRHEGTDGGPGAGTCARPAADAGGTTRVWLRLRAFPAAAGERAGKTSAPLPFGCAEGPPRRAGRRHG